MGEGNSEGTKGELSLASPGDRKCTQMQHVVQIKYTSREVSNFLHLEASSLSQEMDVSI